MNTKQQIQNVINGQKYFFAEGHTRSVDFRLNVLRTILAAIDEYESRILEALKQDLGKSAFEGYTTEIGMVKSELKYHIKHIRSLSGGKRKFTTVVNFPSSGLLMPEPYGMVLIVSPWNYPFHLSILPLVGAIAAGNTVILKLSEDAPATADVIERMFFEHVQSELVSVFTGGYEMNAALFTQEFDYIFFTGSPALGKVVMEHAARNLTPVTLELGGKSPCIVDKDAKLTIAARRIVFGKLLNCGQTCVAPDYLLVQSSVKQQLLDCIQQSIKDAYGTDVKNNLDYPRIVNEKHFDRLVKLVEGERIVMGGQSNRDSLFIEPTLLDSPSENAGVMKEEIFGPILPVITYENISEAIAFINNRPKPLALYLFSENRNIRKQVLAQTSSGGVCINDTIMQMVAHSLPFGGVGSSGMGRYHGKYSFETFSHYKTILKKSTKIDIPLRYAPFNKSLGLVRRFLG
ncbi:MAG: aldehyde dehydrogenase [Prevotellaceae bacterium]|jgi:aldehyde dehydrogenase (NAD+)|nr:aldehyde dehydrogenase [Prevotellaceae bacterium]